jgi:hypothetical protein
MTKTHSNNTVMEDSSDSDDKAKSLVVYTADEILRFGLQLVG